MRAIGLASGVAALVMFAAGCSGETERASAPASAETAAAPTNSVVDENLRAANLAPMGTLRAAFIATNPIHGRVDPLTGTPTGPVPDIVTNLSARIGVPFSLMPMESADAVIEQVKSGAADIGFVAYDDTRAQEVVFGPAFAQMRSSYLVAADSPLQTSAEVEAAGNIIGAVSGRSQQLYLSGAGKAAEIRVFDEQPADAEMERLVTSGELSAFALNRQRSVDLSAAFPTLRAVGDSFLDAPQSFIVRKGDEAKVAPVNAYADELKATGFFAAALERANLGDSASAP